MHEFTEELFKSSCRDDLDYIANFVRQVLKDLKNGDMGYTLECVCDIATLRQVTQLIKEKYY